MGIGIYCDESGCIPLLRAVQQVEEQLAKHPKPRGYLPIDGLPAYIKATQQLLFGVDSLLLTAGRVATSQTVGGSGALRVAAEVLKQVLPHATVAISRPSWENHRALFTAAGFKIEDYTYFDTLGHAVDFTGMVADLAKLQPKTVVLLHGCCHNPTGADLSRDQWKQLVALFQERHRCLY